MVAFFHGLTGSPADFRPFVGPYVAAGYDVVVPLMPGHGSHVSLLERLTYRELSIPFHPLVGYLRGRYQQVHLVALSYGSIPAAEVSLSLPVTTLSFLAPAFFLHEKKEKDMLWAKRLRIHHFRNRIPKNKTRTEDFSGDANVYGAVPLGPARELHDRARMIRERLGELDLPVFHAHGDADPTTSFTANHQFLKRTLRDYHFYPIHDGLHVLPLDAHKDALAAAHLAWLAERAPRVQEDADAAHQ